MRLIRSFSLAALVLLVAAPAARAQGHANLFIGSNFSGDAGRSLSSALNDGSRFTWGGDVGGTIKGIFGAEVDLAYARHFYGSDASLGNNYVFTLMPTLILGVPVGGESGPGFRPYGTAGFGLISRDLSVNGIDAIKDNKDWQGGEYTHNPARDAEYEFGSILLTTPQEFNKTHTRQQVLKELAEAKTSNQGSDANDKIRQVEAMMSLNVAEPYGDSLEKAAAAVKARLLVIVGKEDHTVTPSPAIEFAHALGAQLLVIDDGCGHQYCDHAGVEKAVADFLEK